MFYTDLTKPTPSIKEFKKAQSFMDGFSSTMMVFLKLKSDCTEQFLKPYVKIKSICLDNSTDFF